MKHHFCFPENSFSITLSLYTESTVNDVTGNRGFKKAYSKNVLRSPDCSPSEHFNTYYFFWFRDKLVYF